MIEIRSKFQILILPLSKKLKQINAKPSQLCANYSCFAQGIYLIDKTDKKPLGNSRIVQPSRNSYFVQSHSRMVSFPTLQRTYISSCDKFVKTYFAIALSIPWTVFIPIVCFSALNSCIKFSDLVAWC